LSVFWNYKICKNNEVIDSEIEGKIKRAWTDNITKCIKDKSMKCEAWLNVNCIIGSLPTDTIIEQNISKVVTPLEFFVSIVMVLSDSSFWTTDKNLHY